MGKVRANHSTDGSGSKFGRPLVSVVTPSFNQARWLRDCIESVRNQDYPAIEHIIKDGGSTDGSVELLEALGGTGPRWQTGRDGGQSEAINIAVEQAHGDIIGWLNSDDAFFARDVVSTVVRAFGDHPDVDVVYGHAALVNASGLILQAMWAPPMWKGLLRHWDFIVQPTVFVRRSAFRDKLVDPELGFMMDWELWLRLAASRRFHRVDRTLAIDRHQADRKIVRRQDLALADLDRLQEEHGAGCTGFCKVPVKLLKIAARLAGVGLVPELLRADLAFGGGRDASWRLIVRQLTTTRARMPFES